MLVVNPVSGKGRIRGCLLDILTSLCADGSPVTVFATGRRGDAMHFAEEYGAGYERLVCTGGDGTLNEVISGLMKLPPEERPIVGYIPLGTTNDVASTFKLPKTPSNAIALIEKNHVRSIDVGRLGDANFEDVAAFGAFTDISAVTPQAAKNTWGFLAYLLEALNSLQRIVPCHARVVWDDGELEDDFIFGAVANSTSVAGVIKLRPGDVKLDDGLFEVLLIRMPANAADLNLVISNVLKQDFENDYVRLIHTRRIRFEFSSDVTWTTDGENGGTYRTVEAVNFHRAISLLV